jgi:hypothetical protein
MLATASAYHLPPRLLSAIQQVEGGTIGAVHSNTNGSDDLGVMQINSAWLPRISSITGLPTAQVRDRLVGDGCFNVAAAGMILRTALDEADNDLLRAIGFYHSHNDSFAEPYRARVLAAAHRLFARAADQPASSRSMIMSSRDSVESHR